MKGGQYERMKIQERCKRRGMEKDSQAKGLGRPAIIENIRHNYKKKNTAKERE